MFTFIDYLSYSYFDKSPYANISNLKPLGQIEAHFSEVVSEISGSSLYNRKQRLTRAYIATDLCNQQKKI